jgi:hypothetical protein
MAAIPHRRLPEGDFGVGDFDGRIEVVPEVDCLAFADNLVAGLKQVSRVPAPRGKLAMAIFRGQK